MKNNKNNKTTKQKQNKTKPPTNLTVIIKRGKISLIGKMMSCGDNVQSSSL